MKFCAEIQYETSEGGVHSDLCHNCNPSAEVREVTEEFRQVLHRALDEWLNKSNGTGAFWVGDPEYFRSWFTVELRNNR